MGELLRLRLEPVMGLAAAAVLAFFALRKALAALAASGRIRIDASRRSLFADLGYMVLGPATELLSRILTVFVIMACAVLAGRHVGPELLDGFGPVARQPRWAIVVEMLVLSDVVYYWVHRAAHTVPALWRLHAVHHSTKHLRWSSAMRAHPAETYLHVLVSLPLIVLGFPVDALVVVGPLTMVYALVIHCNVNVSAGYLSYIFNNPRFHGWHHALDAKDGGVNFAGFFPIFDALFGTYKLPDHLPSEYGMDDHGMPETCAAQLVYPFRGLGAAHRDEQSSDRAGGSTAVSVAPALASSPRHQVA